MVRRDVHLLLVKNTIFENSYKGKEKYVSYVYKNKYFQVLQNYAKVIYDIREPEQKNPCTIQKELGKETDRQSKIKSIFQLYYKRVVKPSLTDKLNRIDTSLCNFYYLVCVLFV